DALRVATPLVVEEEEELVLAAEEARAALAEAREVDGAADGAAELVARQLRARDAAPVVEEAVGGGRGGAVELAQRPVEQVRAALRDQLDLAAAAPALGGAGVGRDGAELLYRVDGRVARRGGELPRGLVVGVNAVHRDVTLVGARAGHGAHAVGGRRADVVADDARLEADERGRRAANLHGQVNEAARLDDVADAGVGRVQRGLARGRHRDGLGDLPRGQLRVVRLDVADAERHVGDRQRLEAGAREGELVAAPGLHLVETVDPLLVGRRRQLFRSLRVRE